MSKNRSTPYRAFLAYMALRTHFTDESFDAPFYGYKINYSEAKFEARRDKKLFTGITMRYPNFNKMIHYYVANMIIVGPTTGIKSFSYDNYMIWKGRTQGLTYNFLNDCRTLKDKYDNPKELFKGDPPVVFDEYMGGVINPETLTIFNMLTGCVDKIKDHPMFGETALMIRKYPPFLKVNKKELAKEGLEILSG